MKRSAFTLLEVVVGMVLMAGLVSGTLLAISSQQASLRLAGDRRDACVAAEQMMERWFESLEGVPSRSNGLVDPGRPWVWRTEPVGQRFLLGVPVQVIRFQIINAAPSSRNFRMTVLVQTDLVQRVRRGAIR